ncbi:hypothetical protein SAMN05216321_102223 [Cupriavidus sp. OV038]|jgi:hypothetical protein|uniref:hypothetical protein n=1 Tax=unclassified Cupriavidus TaxID=2640874 RepID=UPI0008EE2377|nr:MULTISPECIES: hypothetical protein [unclassified Cupriavidus]SFB93481.1 hypothetical protein SAMN05216321_102223 [Cupriavidus sp. OV038]SFO96667.1 hypothetical protein SAMN05216322_103393 [Cupriavidus sp. OV096]
MSTHQDNQRALNAMREALASHVAGTMPVADLVGAWRAAATSLTLPPVFGQAMEELLRRLEMSAVFAQDSCSFSSTAVTDQLKRWLDKAEAS